MKKKIFIDCGFHHGEGLRHFIDVLNIDGSWHVVAFEPNPECKAEERIKSICGPLKIEYTFTDRAVWIKKGVIEFAQENHFVSESGSPTDGCSMIDGWGSQVANLHGRFPGLQKPILVKSTDFSWFLHGVFIAFDGPEIYCKMDIEGAEFPVIRQMLATNAWRYIKKIWIEFHEQYIPGESDQSKRDLINQLSQFTEVGKWH